jgi:GT2 family glycosyltransferase
MSTAWVRRSMSHYSERHSFGAEVLVVADKQRNPVQGMNMDLCIVLVNWRKEEETRRCATALMRWQKLQPKVLIIDNESTEASRAALREFIGADQLVCSATNLGYSGGNNLGIEHALAAGCEYILLLNADADLPEDSARRLLKRLEENPQVSILGPVIVEAPHGWDQPLAGGRDIARHVFTRVKLRRDRIKQLRDYPLRAVDYVPGTVFLARAELFRDTGLLDEKYFFSGEIADLCKRASAKAQGICIDLEVEVRHRPEAAAANSRAVLYTYYSLRNRFLYVSKHHAASRHLYFLYWTTIAALMLVHALARRNPSKARAILLAVIDGYQHRFGNQNALFASGPGARA